MSEQEVVMALSQKMAMLERRLDKVAKLHMALSERYEYLLERCELMDTALATLVDVDD
jgi:hypothetical protein